MRLLRNYWGLAFVLLLSIPAILPFFQSGFFPMHDDTQVARVFEMGKMLRMGAFPVRWVPDLGYGYGYPIFNFYAPLAYYVGGLFTLFFDALIATKIMMSGGILLAGISMYLLARKFWGEAGGGLSALFYMYAPYHALDMYVRGDVAELYAYAFIPLAFLGLYGAYKIIQSSAFRIQNIWKWTIVGAVGFAGVILSHNLTAMMVTPFLLVFIAVLIFSSKKKINTGHFLLHIIFFGLLFSAFYWLPALTEMGKTNVVGQIGSSANFRDHFVCVQQLWDSPWGFGGSAPGCINDGLSFRIGKLHLLLGLLSFLAAGYLFIKNKKSEKTWAVILSSIGFLIATFFTLEISKPVWEMVSPMAFFQYPWRFLLLASFFLSFSAGFLVWGVQEFSKNKTRGLLSTYGLALALSISVVSFN